MQSKLHRFASILFEPGEWIGLAPDKKGIKSYPLKALAKSAEWAEFLCINPLQPFSTRKDQNVAKLRTLLIEFDKLPLKEQLSFVRGRGMPYSAAVYSGGKSLHFLVSLDSPLVDGAAYRALHRAICAKLEGHVDTSNSNPSRLSRCPGHRRDDTSRLQSIVELHGRVPQDLLAAWLGIQQLPITEAKRKIMVTQGVREALRTPLSLQTTQFLERGASPGKNHRSFVNAALDFRNSGWSFEETFAKLRKVPWPTEDPGELDRIMEYVFNESP